MSDIGIKILATGSYVPESVVTNDQLAEVIDTNDQWIVEHTGINTRHYSLNGENTSDLATKAANIALERAKMKAEDIDLILLSTITPDSLTPQTAAIVQQKIGADNAFAFDISTACAGFIFATSTASKFLQSGMYKNALVISAEVNSKMMDFTDRTSTVFFGDGAGAMVIQTSPLEESNIISENLHTRGNKEAIHSGRIAPLTKISSENFPKTDAFFQNGREVFDFATNTIPGHIDAFLKTQDMDTDQVDKFILHQANLRIIENIAGSINQSMDKFPHNVDYLGNTSSAGIAIAFDELFQNSKINKKKSETVLLTGFGAGLSYGSILLKL